MNNALKVFAITSLAFTLCGTAHANTSNTNISAQPVNINAQPVNASQTVPSAPSQHLKDAAPKPGEFTRRRIVTNSVTGPNKATRIVSKDHMVIVPHMSNDDMTIYGPKPTQLGATGQIPNYYKN